MGQTTRLSLLKLAEVFDFSNTHWVESVQSAQENSFETELEFYELLDRMRKARMMWTVIVMTAVMTSDD